MCCIHVRWCDRQWCVVNRILGAPAISVLQCVAVCCSVLQCGICVACTCDGVAGNRVRRTSSVSSPSAAPARSYSAFHRDHDVSKCKCVCMYVCMYVCIYIRLIHAHKHTVNYGLQRTATHCPFMYVCICIRLIHAHKQTIDYAPKRYISE